MSEPVPISQQAERWWHILRAHRPAQLGWRALKMAHRRLFPLLPKSRYTDADGGRLKPRNNGGFETILKRHLELRSQQGRLTERVDRLLRGEFCFLGETRDLGPCGETSLEKVAQASHLWRFHWHYQEYLLDLLAAARADTHPDAAARISDMIEVWIQSHPIDRSGSLSDAWHPFCLSRRIPVWLLVWHAGLISEDMQLRFAGSLEAQIRFLERHLEWDLRGNHLLENLKALALAGAFFDGETADRRLHTAQRFLEEQLVEQVLPSGEHFERSPMYHAQMLAAVLDIRDAVAGLSPLLSQRCDHVAQQMAAFLESVLHPDGQIPLLADSALGETPAPGLLIDASHVKTKRSESSQKSPARQIGQSWVWRDETDFLLFDAGPVGANELPAHAHGDLLTFEASLGGERLIVDSGVYDYQQSEMRRYCRSTAAHNVLQVDEAEQCDLWSRFRMGRRGTPTSLVTGFDGEFAWAGATHNAYRHLGVPTVGRWIACRPGGPWIFVDWADGEGEHQLTHWLHFVPDTELDQVADREINLSRGDWSGNLRYLSEGTVSLETAWYCPDFGVRHRAPVVRFERRTRLPSHFVSVLNWGESTGEVSLNTGDSERFEIGWETGADRLTWSPKQLLLR